MDFTAESVLQYLNCSGLTFDIRDCVTSTNTLLKQMGHAGAAHGLVLAAAEQTAGRGRMGRSFYSPDRTGVYFSILLRPELSPADSLLITTGAAVAVARALEGISGRKAEIKWVNDIYMDGKKVCGILTEAAITPDGKKLNFAVLGIGINLYTPDEGFPTDIKDRAGSVLPNHTDDLRGRIVAEVLNEFFTMYPLLEKREFIKEYRQRSMLDGLYVDVIKPDRTMPATVLQVAEDLTLAVQYPSGEIEYLNSGDVSIRKQ